MSKRDYYEVLGIERGADQKEIKKPTGAWHRNTIRTVIRTMTPPRRSSARFPRPMRS